MTDHTALQPVTRAWEAANVDAVLVQQALDDLWNTWHEQHQTLDADRAGAADPGRMRPSTINLIVLVDSEQHADQVVESLDTLTDIQPSRTILINSGGAPESPDGFQVSLAVSELPPRRNRPPLSREVVTIAAAPGHSEQLASVVSPLLLPDLPEVLYLDGTSPAADQLATELIEFADELIFDSAKSADSARDFGYLANLPDADSRADVADFAWYRSQPWRQWIAQFFDPPDMVNLLDEVSEVHIRYRKSSFHGGSGFSAALLTAAWLASRLKWRAPGELLPRDGGWHSTFRSGSIGRSREVSLTITSAEHLSSGNALQQVIIRTGNPATGLFQIERVDESNVEAFSKVGLNAPVQRIIFSKELTTNAILGEILKSGADDDLFRESLTVASVLWPVGAIA